MRRLPWWIWVVELIGAAMVVLAAFVHEFAQAALLAFGVGFLLALPLMLIQRGVESRLTQTVETALAQSLSRASGWQLSGPSQPFAPEELKLWPFQAHTRAGRDERNLELVLTSAGAWDTSWTEPIEVSIVVTDPIGRTFNTDRRVTDSTSPEIATWQWPDDFTSGDIRPGNHSVAFFVASIAVGPARRFGLVAQAAFRWAEPSKTR